MTANDTKERGEFSPEVEELIAVSQLVVDRCLRRKRAMGNGYKFMPEAEDELQRMIAALRALGLARTEETK